MICWAVIARHARQHRGAAVELGVGQRAHGGRRRGNTLFVEPEGLRFGAVCEVLGVLGVPLVELAMVKGGGAWPLATVLRMPAIGSCEPAT